MVRLILEIRLSRRLCPIEQNGIHPSRVAGGNGLLEQIKEALKLLLKIGADFHAACQFLPDARDPRGADFGKHGLDGSRGLFPRHDFRILSGLTVLLLNKPDP